MASLPCVSPRVIWASGALYYILFIVFIGTQPAPEGNTFVVGCGLGPPLRSLTLTSSASGETAVTSCCLMDERRGLGAIAPVGRAHRPQRTKRCHSHVPVHRWSKPWSNVWGRGSPKLSSPHAQGDTCCNVSKARACELRGEGARPQSSPRGGRAAGVQARGGACSIIRPPPRPSIPPGLRSSIHPEPWPSARSPAMQACSGV
jgi:hypothetical protein